MNTIIKFALNNRLLIVILAVLVLISGSYIAVKMEIDVLPDLTSPTVVVLTECHGMAPEEVERLVTFQIETAVNGATNVRRVRSSSSAGFSVVWVEFEWGMDIFLARQIVNEKIASVTGKLPEGVSNPMLAPQSSIMGEIMTIAVSSDSVSPMDLRVISDWQIKPRLLSIAGVANVIVTGGDYKQYQILANPVKMKYFNVSLTELLNASKGTNQNSSGGFLNEYGNEYIITGIGRTTDVDEIANSVVKLNKNKPIRISEIAEVKIGLAPKIGAGFLNGKPAVIITILKQPNINTVEVTKKLDETLADIQKTLPASVEINTEIYKQADFINTSVRNVQKVLLEGGIFVSIILFLFLMNFRTTVITLIAMPLSLLVTIITLKLLGLNINTMSLGGMAIAIGALVDDAIIDVYNVLKYLKENARKPDNEKENTLTLIFNASKEIRASIMNATFIIIVAFIPLFFLSGMEGKLLQPLGISFIVSLFASLIIAITLTPVLCSYLLTNEKHLLRQQNHSWLSGKLNAAYKKSLTKIMQRKKVLLNSAAVMLVVSLIIFFTLGRSFLPEFNEGSFLISAVSQPGISLDVSNEIVSQVDEALLSLPEVQNVARRTGRAEMDEHAQGTYSSEIDVPFVLKGRSKNEMLEEMRTKLAAIRGINTTIGQPLGHRIDHMLSGTRANIAIKIFGDDLDKMFTLSNQIKKEIEGIDGLVDLNVEPQVKIPQLQIKAKRDMLAFYGITISEFTEFIDVAFAGEKVGNVYEGSQSYDLVLRYNDEHRNKITAVKNSLIDTPNGKIPLSFVADIVSTVGPNIINKENVERKVVVSANVAGRDLRSVVEDVQQKIKEQITLPQNYRIEYGGQFESEQRATTILLIASIMAIFIIFFLLYHEFKNAIVAGVILLNLPLALIGGVLTVFFTSGILNIPAIIGFITLFGIATRNGILLVSRYEHLKQTGKNLYEIVMEGSLERLNPILMTALTAALALVPLVIAGDKPGNEIQSPMAIVILGGLLSSTLMNIYVVPVIYYLINRNKFKN